MLEPVAIYFIGKDVDIFFKKQGCLLNMKKWIFFMEEKCWVGVCSFMSIFFCLIVWIWTVMSAEQEQIDDYQEFSNLYPQRCNFK